MDRYFEIKKRLLQTAATNDGLRAVILIGSSVREYAVADEYSDLNVILVCDEPEAWLYGDLPGMLGDVRISFVEPTFGGGMERRILYSGSLDVDLIVLTPEQMESAITGGVAGEVMNRGYCVLYDDMMITDRLKGIPARVQRGAMTEREFLNIVNDFWFHAVWSAKKILRGELWAAKMCIDAYMKGLLLKIIEESEADNKDVWHNGRFLEKWAGGDTIAELGNCFAHYDRENMLSALSSTMVLCAKLARRTAEKRGYLYPAEAEACAMSFVKDRL